MNDKVILLLTTFHINHPVFSDVTYPNKRGLMQHCKKFSICKDSLQNKRFLLLQLQLGIKLSASATILKCQPKRSQNLVKFDICLGWSQNEGF